MREEPKGAAAMEPNAFSSFSNAGNAPATHVESFTTPRQQWLFGTTEYRA